MDVAVICGAGVAQLSSFAHRAGHLPCAIEAVLLLLFIPAVCVVRVERLHRFVVCVEAAIQFGEYRVAGYFDFVHIFFEFDVMPDHRMQRTRLGVLVSIHASRGPGR